MSLTVTEPMRHVAGRQKVAMCGTDGGYYRHLRVTKSTPCSRCRAAHAAAARGNVRPRPRSTVGLVPVEPTRDLLRELAVMGWSVYELARVAGYPAATLIKARQPYRRFVTVDLAEAVTGTYNRMGLRRGPSSRTAARAMAAGWDADPRVKASARDVDHAVVSRAVAGDRTVRLGTTAEREAAVTVLHRQRLPDRRIAARLNLEPRTVLRIRQRLGLPAVPEQQRAAS